MVFNNYVHLYTFDTVVKIIMSNITSQAATCNVKDMYVTVTFRITNALIYRGRLLVIRVQKNITGIRY